MTSRKLYKRIAEGIRFDLDRATLAERNTIATVIRESVAVALKADNSNFRYDIFFEACGLDEYGYVK